jgi:hypothetical protein
MDNKVLRASFEDTIKNRERLLALINKLTEENRQLGESERPEFIQLLARCTLGLGTRLGTIRLIGKDKNGIGRCHDFAHVEEFARWLAFAESNKVMVDDMEFDIAKLWHILRDNLFLVFPLALERAMAQSGERVKHEQQGGVGYGP